MQLLYVTAAATYSCDWVCSSNDVTSLLKNVPVSVSDMINHVSSLHFTTLHNISLIYTKSPLELPYL